MGLSNDKMSLTSFQVFLELAQGFKDLSKINVDKLVKETYEISESEKAKAAEARDKISYYESLRKDCESRTKELDFLEISLEKKEASLDKKSKDLDIRETFIRREEESLSKQANTLKDKESSLTASEEAMKVSTAKVRENLEFSIKAKEASEILRKELKSRLEALSKL